MCVNDREGSSHGHWGYGEALGTCCDLEPVLTAVSVREREEGRQLLDTFPGPRRPLWGTQARMHAHRVKSGEEQRSGREGDPPQCVLTWPHGLSTAAAFPRRGWTSTPIL